MFKKLQANQASLLQLIIMIKKAKRYTKAIQVWLAKFILGSLQFLFKDLYSVNLAGGKIYDI